MSSSGSRSDRKRKHNSDDAKKEPGAVGSSDSADSHSSSRSKSGTTSTIELLDQFRRLRSEWPQDMSRLFDPELSEVRQGELWEVMCENGDILRQRFAWAIPDERALRIIKHFAPIVEIGSGLGYWAKLLRDRDVDVKAYDKVAGKPAQKVVSSSNSEVKGDRSMAKGKKADTTTQGDVKRRKTVEEEEQMEHEDAPPAFWTEVEEGGPDALEEACNEKRSLLLCYPDDFEGEEESLGLRCLHSFEGDVVIHVGEVFGDSVSLTPGQTPWGRTTARECQEELASKFHCILKVPLPRWPHSRDTLTVWKRHAFSAVYYDDSDSGSDASEGKDDVSEGGMSNKSGGDDREKSVESSDDPDRSTRRDDSSKKGANKRDAQGDKGGSRSRKSMRQKPHGRSLGDDQLSNGAKATRSGNCKSVDVSEEDSEEGNCGSDDDADAYYRGVLEGREEEMPMSMMPNVDMYAFVPAGEEMSCVQAAPCVRFLLGA